LARSSIRFPSSSSFPKTNAVKALGEADGDSLVTAAGMLLTVATGAMDGASAVTGAASA